MTSSAHWGGSAVGIVRVERELARRAQYHLGPDLSFCLYDASRRSILAIEDDLAADIIEGRVQVRSVESDFDRIAGSYTLLAETRRLIRRTLRRNAIAYYYFQKVRGRSFTREQIREFQAIEFADDLAAKKKGPKVVSLLALPHSRAELDADTTVISGGLDWEFKKLRDLWNLKQKYRFRYYSVVFDLIPIKHPHFVVPGYVELLTEFFGELLWLADRTICISETTRNDWDQHAHTVGAEPVPSKVFSLGSDLSPAFASDQSNFPPTLEGKVFALYVSTIEPRKNHRVLYEAWDECVRSGQVDSALHRLVFVGRTGWACDDLIREMTTNPATKDTLVMLDGVSDGILRTLYERCAFVVFPSHYEGYGLALAEALARGKPCVSSTSGSLTEIGGDLVLRLKAKDTMGWTSVLSRLFQSPEELEQWSARIKAQHQSVTWDDSARCFFAAVKDPTF